MHVLNYKSNLGGTTKENHLSQRSPSVFLFDIGKHMGCILFNTFELSVPVELAQSKPICYMGILSLPVMGLEKWLRGKE